MNKRIRHVTEWLLENSLYWTIKNWFSVRRYAKKEGLTFSGILRERGIEKNEI
jgi:hypothetical protein